MLLQDNAKQQISMVTRHKLQGLGWDVLMYTPYSLHFAPRAYNLFLFMASDFVGERLAQESLRKSIVSGVCQ